MLTNAKGFTLYSFAPDTMTTSKCDGTCAQIWPPVKGPATAGQMVTGKLGTIKRSGGALQATYNGHPLYTYTADTAPGQAKGNGVNASGGIWHEVTALGASALFVSRRGRLVWRRRFRLLTARGGAGPSAPLPAPRRGSAARQSRLNLLAITVTPLHRSGEGTSGPT